MRGEVQRTLSHSKRNTAALEKISPRTAESPIAGKRHLTKIKEEGNSRYNNVLKRSKCGNN